MYSKAEIFNLALSALLLSRDITEPETDETNEAKVLRRFYMPALRKTLVDLDLNATSTRKKLELIQTQPNDFWYYSYKYPNDCAFLRRIVSCVVRDNKFSMIAKQIEIIGANKCILTNEQDAFIEYISKDVDLRHLSAAAGLAFAHQLAWMAAPLITGKGAAKMKQDVFAGYLIHKAEAQEQDALESRTYEDDAIDSEFVAARLS